MKKKALWFKHDFGARNDPKVMDIVLECGGEGGYAYWVIIERLYEQGGTLPTRVYKQIAHEANCSMDTVRYVVEQSGLFTVENDMFYSERVLEALGTLNEKSEKARMAVLTRWNGGRDTDVIRTYNERNTDVLQTQCGRNTDKDKDIDKDIDTVTVGVIGDVNRGVGEEEEPPTMGASDEASVAKPSGLDDLPASKYPNPFETEYEKNGQGEAQSTQDGQALQLTLEDMSRAAGLAAAATSRRQSIPPREFIDMYHSLCPDLPRVRAITKDRANRIRLRTEEMSASLEGDLRENLKTIFTKMQQSDFLKGTNDRGYKAGIDFILEAGKWSKVLEGFYDNREARPAVQTRNNPQLNVSEQWNR